MKNVTFEQINLFLKSKLRKSSVYAHKNRPTCVAIMHVHASTILRTHGRFQKLCKESFLHSNWVLERISHHLGVILNPYFFNINSHTWYIFKKQWNPKGKHLDLLEIVNQRGCFSKNIFKSIFFWLRSFLALIFEFKITNHIFIDCEWIWLKGMVKNQA